MNDMYIYIFLTAKDFAGKGTQWPWAPLTTTFHRFMPHVAAAAPQQIQNRPT